MWPKLKATQANRTKANDPKNKRQKLQSIARKIHTHTHRNIINIQTLTIHKYIIYKFSYVDTSQLHENPPHTQGHTNKSNKN